MAFHRFIGVTRRRFGLVPPDLSALDGVKPTRGGTLTIRKNRSPRRVRKLPRRDGAIVGL